MGHCIQGFVGRYADMLGWADVREGSVVAPLAQGFGLMVEPEPAYDLYTGPSPADRDWCERNRSRVATAFVATEYSGGPGEQGAAAWTASGSLDYSIADFGTINAALGLIGVTKSNGCDEFDSVGLGWYRDNDDWIEFATNGKADFEKEAWPAAAAAFAALHTARA